MSDEAVGSPRRVLVTGAGGLLGFHLRALLLAKNGERRFHGEAPAFDVVEASRADFADAERLSRLAHEVEAVFHLAGINRATPDEVEGGNERIADTLIAALESSGSRAHVVYADSTHSAGDSPYGRGKRRAGECLGEWARRAGGRYTGVVLPHIFGEGGRPFYNTVTATLCDQVAREETPEIHAGAAVELLHAGAAAELMLDCVDEAREGELRAAGTPLSVAELHERLVELGRAMDADVFPDLSDSLTVQLYNTYRFARFPAPYPVRLPSNADARGELFEAARGGGGGQTFLSWTKPGIERGNHFHRRKVERFLVVQGQAEIRVRQVFADEVHRFAVRGEEPMAIDMPTLHSHSIVNTGDTPLLTLFWAHEVFDSKDTDTYMQTVVQTPEGG